ncbi:MAG TPA: CPBP family intramembrane glutamic endopeptidase [Nocardioidaceae bacterium]|nr:CPBP family intramembrane glutamic endopeptidase [Nocardioidaceae bacterium]
MTWGPGEQGGQAWPPPQPRRQALPSYPHPEPRSYHEMLRTWNYAWWRPVLGLVLVAFGMIIVAPLVLMPVLAAGVAVEGGPFLPRFEKAATLQTVDPAALLYLNLVLGSMILVTWLAMRLLHRMRPRWLASVKPRLRWKFLFACLGLAVVALIAQVLVGAVMPGNDEGISGHLNHLTGTTVSLAAIVLFTTPLQAAGEEYVFRGYLLQAFGALFRSEWVAITISAVLFAFAHGGQNFPLFFDRFFFGFIAAWLVTRTGGLEAGIAMHVLNNFLAFGLALSFGNITDTLNVSQVGWSNIALTLTQSGVYALLVLWLAKKMNLRTRTRPPQRQQPDPSYAPSVLPSGS